MLIILFSIAFFISIFAVAQGVFGIFKRQKQKKKIERNWKELNTENKNYISEHLLDE